MSSNTNGEQPTRHRGRGRAAGRAWWDALAAFKHRGDHRRRNRRALAIAATIALTASIAAPVIVTSHANSASASTAGTFSGGGSYIGGVVDYAYDEPMVAWKVPGFPGAVAGCVTPNLDPPYATYSKRTESSATKKNALLGTLAYMIWDGDHSDKRVAEVADYISWQVSGNNTMQTFVNNGQDGLSLSDQNTLIDKAKTLAGPYTVTFSSLGSASTNQRGSYTTSYVHVDSVYGLAAPGVDVTLSSGTASFADATVTTNSNGDAAFKWMAPTSYTGTSVSITGTVKYVQSYYLYHNGQTQDLVGQGPLKSAGTATTAPLPPAYVPANIIKYATGDASKTPIAGAQFNIVDATTGTTLANITTKTTPVAISNVVPGHTLKVTETAAPPRFYLPANPVAYYTVPSGGLAIQFADPQIQNVTVATVAGKVNPGPATGQQLTDTVTVRNNNGGSGSIASVVYGPAPLPASGQCSDVTLAQWNAAGHSSTITTSITPGSGGWDASGNGTVTVTGPIEIKPGCYGWGVIPTIEGTQEALYPPTSPNEQWAIKIDNPTVSTTATLGGATGSQPYIAGGYVASDSLTLSGNDSHSGFTVASTFYGPVPVPTTASDCSGVTSTQWSAAPKWTNTKAYTTTTATTTITLTGPTVSSVGCYGWKRVVTMSDTDLGIVLTSFTDAANPASIDPHEANLIVGPPVAIAATTAQVDGADPTAGITVGANGHDLSDTVRVTGDSTGEPIKIVTTLYGPVDPGQEATDCSGVTQFQWLNADTVTSTKVVPYSSAAFTTNTGGEGVDPGYRKTSAGCFGFGQAVTATGSGAFAESFPWDSNESVLIRNPQVTISSQVTALITPQMVGHLIDKVTLAGNDGEDGTVTDAAYGPVDVPVSGKCADVTTSQWGSAPLYDTAADQAVSDGTDNGDGTTTYTFTVTTPSDPGCYGWKATAGLNTSGVTVVSQPSDANEQTKVTAPYGSTQVSSDTAVVGDDVSDTATIGGNLSTTFTGTDTVVTDEGQLIATRYFHPFSSDTESCPTDEAGWKQLIDDGTVETTSEPVDPNHGPGGQYESDSFKTDKAGCISYSWAWIAQEGATPVVLSSAGAPNEVITVVAPAAPTEMTQLSGSANGYFTDYVTVNGTHGVPTVINDMLYGPVPANADGSCKQVDFQSVRRGGPATTFNAQEVTADGTYKMAQVAIPKEGVNSCYVGFATLSTATTTIYSPPTVNDPLETAMVESLVVDPGTPTDPPTPPTPPVPPVNTGLGANAGAVSAAQLHDASAATMPGGSAGVAALGLAALVALAAAGEISRRLAFRRRR